MNWELFSFMREAPAATGVLWAEVVLGDTTRETGFNGRTESFVPDAIVGKELSIIIHFTAMSQCHLMLRVILCTKSPANEALTKHFNRNVKPWGYKYFGWGWTTQWNKVGRFFFFWSPECWTLKYLPADATLVRRIRISTNSTQSKVSLTGALFTSKADYYLSKWARGEKKKKHKKNKLNWGQTAEEASQELAE